MSDENQFTTATAAGNSPAAQEKGVTLQGLGSKEAPTLSGARALGKGAIFHSTDLPGVPMPTHPPMTQYPLQIVGLVPISSPCEEGTERTEMRRDVQWGTPIFRPPILPTPQQIHCEVPFTENLRSRFRARP